MQPHTFSQTAASGEAASASADSVLIVGALADQDDALAAEARLVGYGISAS